MSTSLKDKTQPVRLPGAGTWEIDPSHSTIEAVARHLMVTKVRGRFTDFEGRFEISDKPEDTKIELSIRADSIATGDDKRDGHLRSPDFLDAEGHPTLQFRSTKIEPKSDGTYRVTGDLTIRGASAPIVIESAYLGLATDPWGNEKAAFSGTTELDREAFGMTWNQVLESGGVLVGKKLAIELEVQAARA
jgi:polyisoprenoid-binding protein YceI